MSWQSLHECIAAGRHGGIQASGSTPSADAPVTSGMDRAIQARHRLELRLIPARSRLFVQ
jgi:hypothetical protein